MSKTKIIFILAVSLLVFNACDQFTKEDQLTEGVIEYNISYLDNNMHNIGTPLLPKKMVLKFNEAKSVSTIDGFLGFLRISNLTDFDDKNAQTLLQVFENEYVFIGEKGESICCYDAMEDMIIHQTNDTAIIEGLHAHKAIAELPSGEKFDIYYTQDIAIENPNTTNPYHQVDGVLLDFRLTMDHLKMRFTAEEVKQTPIKEEDFDIYTNPKRISRESMSKIMNKLME